MWSRWRICISKSKSFLSCSRWDSFIATNHNNLAHVVRCSIIFFHQTASLFTPPPSLSLSHIALSLIILFFHPHLLTMFFSLFYLHFCLAVCTSFHISTSRICITLSVIFFHLEELWHLEKTFKYFHVLMEQTRLAWVERILILLRAELKACTDV